MPINGIAQLGSELSVAMALFYCMKVRREGPLPPPPEDAATRSPHPDLMLQRQVRLLGAVLTARGWTLTAWCGQLESGKAVLQSHDVAKLAQIAKLLVTHSRLRVVMEITIDTVIVSVDTFALAQWLAISLLCDLVEMGGDPGRMRVRVRGAHAFSRGSGTMRESLPSCRVEILFSDADGQFNACIDRPPSGRQPRDRP